MVTVEYGFGLTQRDTTQALSGATVCCAAVLKVTTMYNLQHS
jgi:hypothetical protein